MKVRIDIPIQNSEEDVLGRAKLAESFSEQLLSLDASEGVVTGVLGPWGSGKTSFVNLVRPHLKKAGIEILDFNPWMFSGTEQLVESFFVELSAQLRGRDCRRFDELAEGLERYGEIFSGMGWLPVVGPWIERLRLVMKPLAKLRELRKEGITGRKGKVEKALADLTKPLVVVVDDIDRLTTPEIRAVFKLVRLTANFPNIIYITAFDRARVENALGGQEGISGRDYLEKILQWAIDLPEVPEEVMVSPDHPSDRQCTFRDRKRRSIRQGTLARRFSRRCPAPHKEHTTCSSLCHCNSRYCASPQRPNRPGGCSRPRSRSHVSSGFVFYLAQIDTQPHHDFGSGSTHLWRFIGFIVVRESDQRTDR